MSDEPTLPLCQHCGEPQEYLHDIGSEIRCGEVTVTGEYAPEWMLEDMELDRGTDE